MIQLRTARSASSALKKVNTIAATANSPAPAVASTDCRLAPSAAGGDGRRGCTPTAPGTGPACETTGGATCTTEGCSAWPIGGATAPTAVGTGTSLGTGISFGTVASSASRARSDSAASVEAFQSATP